MSLPFKALTFQIAFPSEIRAWVKRRMNRNLGYSAPGSDSSLKFPTSKSESERSRRVSLETS